MNITEAYNYKAVNEQVSCSGTLKGINLQSLGDSDYKVIINLLPDDDEYAVTDEKNIIESLGIGYEYIPVDWDNPKGSDFEAFQAVLSSYKDQKIHIHCGANYRASAFYSLYAVKHLGWSTAEAEEFISTIWDKNKYLKWEKFITDLLKDN